MRALKAINFSYVATEDRILAAINPGGPDAWSCWLTRRVVLALLDRAAQFLASTSALMQQAPAGTRGELATFEREAALASTERAMSDTPAEVLKIGASAAELVERLTISSQADGFQVELRGEKGGSAAGLFARAELQRLLQMLQISVAKADWLGTAATSSAGPAPDAAGSKPVQH